MHKCHAKNMLYHVENYYKYIYSKSEIQNLYILKINLFVTKSPTYLRLIKLVFTSLTPQFNNA